MPIRFLTAGESHGKALIGILEGIPSGLLISAEEINKELRRRQAGYGRGGRMKIETDRAEILSGVRFGRTIGSPITLLIENKDWENWKEIMSVERQDGTTAINNPRPGHADLAGAVKYDTYDIRNIIERSSARETAARVALGAVTKKFLSEFNVKIGSYVTEIGNQRTNIKGQNLNSRELIKNFVLAENSSVRCPDHRVSKKMIHLVDQTAKKGDSLGGIFEVFATGLPIGLGSFVQADKRINSRLAQAVMSIQAVKGVEIGMGFEMSRKSGSQVMDEIFYNKSWFFRKTNNAGGIEGGMTNGMPLVLRAAMKPIPTLKKQLSSVDIKTKRPFKAAYERSDMCAVPAAAVIAEAMTSLVIANAFLEKFGGDSMAEVKRNNSSYKKYVSQF